MSTLSLLSEVQILLDLWESKPSYIVIRGGVENTRLEVKAKDTKNPRPRPRTAFPNTNPLEAKDRNTRGQGLRTQAQVFSKKKIFKKFSGNLQFIGVPRLLIGVGLNHKSHAMTSSKFFQRGSF